MKELSIEEKAKRYDEAIKKAESLYDYNQPISGANVIIETLFPELKESEDEKFLRYISACCKETIKSDDKGLELSMDTTKRLFAWLKKQGEQKLVDKVEPKFKVGDWINGYYTNYKVLSVNNEGYVVEDVDGNKINILFENEKFHHLWTIEDAKDGDVLAKEPIEKDYQYPFVAIYKERGSNFFNSYCSIGFDGLFYTDDYGHNINVHPATKEQRDLLFSKMKESGYKWDEKNKELKKIDEELSDFERSLKHIIEEAIEDGDTHNLEADADMLLRIAAPWSEKDENMLDRAIYMMEQLGMTESWDDVYHWLRSLKNRIGE